MERPYFQIDFIADIYKGIVSTNDIDDYVRTHDPQVLYDDIWVETIIEPNEYLEMAMKHLETKYHCSWKVEEKKEPEQETAKVVSPFRALVNYPDVDKFMEVLHKKHDAFPKSCDRGRLITKCVCGYKHLSRFPTQEEYESEFEYIKKGGRTYTWKSIEKYFDENDKNWNDIELALDCEESREK